MCTKEIVWRLHLSAPPERVYEAWLDVNAHPRFWCERSRLVPEGFEFEFIDGTQERCAVLESIPASLIRLRYFGARVEIALAAASGGTDLTLTARDVSASDWEDTHAGWLNVLLPFKAWVDFGIDLRNHDPARTWRRRYVDQ